MSSPKLIIFDLDGTVLDSRHSILSAMDEVFIQFSIIVPNEKKLLSVIGLSLEIAFETLLGDKNAHYAARMSDAYRDVILARRKAGTDHDRMFPGALDTLRFLESRDNILLGVATGKALRGIHHMIKTHELGTMFHTLQAADTAPSKPHPGMVLQSMELAGMSASNTVMIGDTSFDMEMARAAGVHALGVSWGYHDNELLFKSGAGQIIDSYDQMLPALGKILDEDFSS